MAKRNENKKYWVYGLVTLAVAAGLYIWSKFRGVLDRGFTSLKANQAIRDGANSNNPNGTNPGAGINKQLAENAVDAWYKATAKGKSWWNINDSEDEMVQALRPLTSANDVVYASQYCKDQYDLSLKTYTLGTVSNAERQQIPYVVQQNWF